MKKYPLACHSTRDPFWYRYSNYLIFRTTRRIHSMQWHKVIYIYTYTFVFTVADAYDKYILCVCIFYIHTYKHTYIHPSRPYIHTHQEFDIPSGNPIWRVGKSSTTSPRTQWFGHQQLVTAVVVGGLAVLLRLWSGISVDFHSDGHICRTWLGWKIVNMLLVAWWNCRTLL